MKHQEVLASNDFRITSLFPKLILTCLFVFLLQITSFGAVFVVTKSADTIDGVCDSDCSLREAIAAANVDTDADVIRFDPNTFAVPQTILLDGTELSIADNSDLTIEGPGSNLLTIDGDMRSRILFVGQSTTATISGIKMIRGNGTGTHGGFGGAVRLFNFSNVRLNNIIATESRATNQGGAIFVANSTLVISDSILSNSRAGSSAGGLFIYPSNVTLIRTAITNNVEGGGIQIAGGNLDIIGCNISDNITGGDGGGIDNGGGIITISDTTLNNNIGRQGGGAISGTNGSISIDNSTLKNNRGEFFGGGAIKSYGKLKVSRSDIIDNVAVNSEGGGGIYHRGSGTTVEITESRIVGNSTTGSGGGILNEGEGLNDNYAMEVRESLIVGNTANQKGGGFINNSDFHFRNVTVHNNTSLTSGGGIANEGLGYLQNVTVAGNQAAIGGGASNPQFLYTRNSIIANNSSSSGISNDWSGYFDSLGFNLLRETNGVSISGNTSGNVYDVDPQLGPLADNGGRTRTIALLVGSPAMDSADPTNFPTSDQRGFSRPKDGDANGSRLPDMGAFEFNSFASSAAPFDFDGDGKTDVAIFRPVGGSGSSEWWWVNSGSGSSSALQFGSETDVIAPGDFTGDGKMDITIFRPSSGEWFVLRSEDFSFYSFPFGAPGDTPVTGDYDGDGKADPAVFRASVGQWFIQRSSDNQVQIVQFGIPGDVAVTADYDGDGKDDIGIYRRSGANGGEWWINRSTQGLIALNFGTSTDLTVPGDYTGDGKADIAFFRPSTGEWFVLRSEDLSFFSFPFGATGDLPSPGDYDGDGRIDAAVFRPSIATWFIQGSTSGTQIQQFGSTGDVPVPNAFVR